MSGSLASQRSLAREGVTLNSAHYSKRAAVPKLSATEEAIVRVLREHGPLSPIQVSRHLGKRITTNRIIGVNWKLHDAYVCAIRRGVYALETLGETHDAGCVYFTDSEECDCWGYMSVTRALAHTWRPVDHSD